MKLRLDHIAIVVADIEGAIAQFTDKLGLPVEKVEEVPAQEAKVAFFPLGDAHLELVSPTKPGSTLQKALEKRGEGLHHLCFEVQSLEDSVTALKQKGVQIASEPKPGAGGSRVAFLHPKSMNGVLIELVEKPSGAC
ncbi:MAG: methylmalonyl-CoA epimerase [Myxococcota bacterium]